MMTRCLLVAVACCAASIEASAQEIPQALHPYPLPTEAERHLVEAGSNCDVLILGEMHGTQEVPAVAASLLKPLSKQGYQVLALEIPSDQREAIAAWATGQSKDIPSFFAEPWPDGRGGIEFLTLIRTALSPPFDWQLICFDISLQDFELSVKKPEVPPSADEIHELGRRRDATMASNLIKQYQRLDATSKVLAICGNLHARTANRASPESPFQKLWPSFAAVLQADRPKQRVTSVNIRPHRGEFYNVGVKPFNLPAIKQAEFRRLKDADYNFQLDLPRGTAATFLKPPVIPAPEK